MLHVLLIAILLNVADVAAAWVEVQTVKMYCVEFPVFEMVTLYVAGGNVPSVPPAVGMLKVVCTSVLVFVNFAVKPETAAKLDAVIVTGFIVQVPFALA